MSGFVTGIAILFLMGAGFVWGREGLGWSSSGIWRSISVNDFYMFVAGRRLSNGGGGIGDAFVWMGQIDLGICSMIIGLLIYYFGARKGPA